MNGNTVLIADDDAAIRTVLSQSLGRAGYDVRTAATARGLWDLVEAGEGSLVVTDVVLPDENAFDLIPRIKQTRPGLPIVVMSARNNILTAISAAEHGAFEYLPKPFDLNELTDTVSRALANTTPRPESFKGTGDKLPLIGRSPAMQEIYRAIARLTRCDLTVLITGESGTGKELAARAIHDYGTRRRGPFVAVNVAAIPRDLIESELFGHERGAFTGAVTRGVGRFEEARGGTLFLDEIGDMPTLAQTRLLRVLQEGEYAPVGARGTTKTDVRIIAATNRDLKALIGQGLFREDLYYRIAVVPLRMPPLRARGEDIPDLLKHFLRGANKPFEAAALSLLERHPWPGNVRELENLVRRLVLLRPEETISAAVVARELDAAPVIQTLPRSSSPGSSGRSIGDERKLDRPHKAGDDEKGRAPSEAGELAHLVEQHLTRAFRAGMPASGLYHRVLEEIERPLLAAALVATQANQLRAAELLGINRNTLRKKLRQHGLEITGGVKTA